MQIGEEYRTLKTFDFILIGCELDPVYFEKLCEFRVVKIVKIEENKIIFKDMLHTHETHYCTPEQFKERYEKLN